MASINGDAAGAGSINPLLLASALVGSWEALDVLFKREDAKDAPMMIPTEEFLALLARARGRITVPDTRDVEMGAYRQPASFAAGELLQGVTPGGDTALHAVGSNGDRQDFLKYAGMVCGRERGLLFAKNHNGDTPLHCAARAGNSKMVSLLIGLAGREGPHGKIAFLRMENKRQETALHEAVRIEGGRILGLKDRKALFDADGGAPEEKIRAFVDQQESTMVKLLMSVDPELANYPEEGISPLYLAILLEKSTIVLTLYCKSGGNLSYCGADGQNALHLALLQDRDKVVIEFLLHCNKSLTTQVDKDGSTPLHFVCFPSRCTWTLEKVLKANPAAMYQADKNGSFPIHVAASVGAIGAMHLLLREFPDTAWLRDAKGKTFLHVAVEKRRLFLVSDVCGKPSLAWILNMQDNDGNTALHLAIYSGCFFMSCDLLGNPEVNLHLTNNRGETPRDLSSSRLPRGMTHAGNCEYIINYALRCVRANHGALRLDNIEEKYSRRLKPEGKDKESERLKDATQSYMVASVLIATMAFSATIAIPGGYRADDHTNGGTPTLAGRYIFDAFIMAAALAFICSFLATTGFMLAGNPMVNLVTRKIYFLKGVLFMSSSVTSLCVAFALGVYMVLAPVAHDTGVMISFLTVTVFLAREMISLVKWAALVRPLLQRRGLQGLVQLACLILSNIAITLWPFIFIFGWGAYARIQLHQLPFWRKNHWWLHQ